MNGVEGTPDKGPRATPVSSHTTHQNPGRVQQLVKQPTRTGGTHFESQTQPGLQQRYGTDSAAPLHLYQAPRARSRLATWRTPEWQHFVDWTHDIKGA